VRVLYVFVFHSGSAYYAHFLLVNLLRPKTILR
jgi:hypothetical protein